MFVPLIRKEIEKLENIEKQRSSNIKEVTSGITKCAYKNCMKGKSGNLNLSNKSAYGRCSLCSEYEHFTCSRTKDWRKINILNGSENYFCTNCYAKHHGSLTLQKHLGVMHVQTSEAHHETIAIKAIIHNTENLLTNDKDSEESVQLSEITKIHQCNICSETFTTEENLNIHIKSSHTEQNMIKCNQCNETFKTEESLNIHEVTNHIQVITFQCETCTKTFPSEEYLNVHISSEHVSEETFKCNECTEVFKGRDSLLYHKIHNHTIQGTNECDLCTFKSSTYENIEAHKKECHVLVHCTICDIFVDSRVLLRKHIKDEHDDTSLEEKKLAEDNHKLNLEIRRVKDDYERLSDIYKKQQEEFNEQKLIIEMDLAKTREGFRQMKAENEELKVKNDTLYKLGNIALKKREDNSPTKSVVDTTEVIHDEIIDIDDIEVLARNKDNGFRRSDPTAPACKPDRPLYSQVAAAQRSQAGRAEHQAHQVPQVHRQQESQNRSSKVTMKYCHYYNNGTCHFEEKYGRKCVFSHEKAPICKFDEKCNRKKCMYSHLNKPKNQNNDFLGRKPQNNSLQALIQQLLGTLSMNQEQTQRGWQSRGWKRRTYQ